MLIGNSTEIQFMHSTESLMSFIREIRNVYKRNEPQGLKFIFHVQFGNGSPTVRQFFIKEKLKI